VHRGGGDEGGEGGEDGGGGGGGGGGGEDGGEGGEGGWISHAKFLIVSESPPPPPTLYLNSRLCTPKGTWTVSENVVRLCGATGVVYTATPSAKAEKIPTWPFRLPHSWSFHCIENAMWEPGMANSELLATHQELKVSDRASLYTSGHVPDVTGNGLGGEGDSGVGLGSGGDGGGNGESDGGGGDGGGNGESDGGGGDGGGNGESDGGDGDGDGGGASGGGGDKGGD